MSKDKPKTNRLIFEKKTQLRQQKKKPVIKKARKIELKQDPPKKRPWNYTKKTKKTRLTKIFVCKYYMQNIDNIQPKDEQQGT